MLYEWVSESKVPIPTRPAIAPERIVVTKIIRGALTPLERADRAKQLLADPVLKEAFGDIRIRLVVQLEQTVLSDVETQHEIALMLQLLKRLRTQLESYVNDSIVDQHREKEDTFIRRMRQTLKV